ncbi:MAG TPA: hypothetical protein EYP59_05175 [Thiotrichaceae bacterium]|nr:hypothetical protein [Thiotrichaceae bacterium]
MALTTVFSLGGISPNISFAVAIIDHIVKNYIGVFYEYRKIWKSDSVLDSNEDIEVDGVLA